MKVRIETPSRLHFTLIDLNGQLGRIDGSLGITLDSPGVILEATKSKETSIEGKETHLIKLLIEKFMTSFPKVGNIHIFVEKTIPRHVGLGSATQLSLAVATVFSKLYNLNLSTRKLASVMGRGGTSGIGVTAFDKGGLILDGGHTFGKNKQKESFLPSRASSAPPPPIIARFDFPKDWFFVLTIPNVTKGKHGKEEVNIFQTRCPISEHRVGEVCRLILMKILPSLIEKDIISFGEGLNELQTAGFNLITRDLMHPIVKACIEYALEEGAFGAGQSSFGPTVFALVKGQKQAIELSKAMNAFLRTKNKGTVLYTNARNEGARIFVKNE